MAFEQLGDRLQLIFKKLKGQTHLSAANMENVLQEVRLALIDADVNYTVVKSFVQRLKQQLVGLKVEESLNPEQTVVKAVHEEMMALLGQQEALLALGQKLTTILVVGLQGGGKTTSCAKLAHHLQKRGKKPLLVAADVYRPAAIEQLVQLANENNIASYFEKESQDVVKIVANAKQYAIQHHFDVLIVDTAGRLHIDQDLMQELRDLKKSSQPQETLLVVDAMSGQDAVNVAQSFHDELQLSGAIMTKLDGDARGGAALSIASATGIKIKFSGTGEKIDDFEAFSPKRMAERILGMGDVLLLIEKAQANIDEKKAKKLTNRMLSGDFDLEDMLQQLEMAKSMGPLGSLAKLLPGAPKLSEADQQRAEERIKKTKAIIYSMTKEERKNPNILRSSRKQRIAKGSGLAPSDVNNVIRQHEQTKAQIKQMSQMMKGRMPRF